MQNKYLYTTGEFAKLNNTNKRTLHYYDEIDLFSPAYKDPETGYRYYTCYQTAQLSFIRMLRESGSSIQEIKTYTSSPSTESFKALAESHILDIDQQINKLIKAKIFLQQKVTKLKTAEHCQHGQIEVITVPEQKLLLSGPINGRYGEDDDQEAASFTDRLKKKYTLFESFGSRISVDHLCQNTYDCFYYTVPDDESDYDAIRPGGEVIRTYSIGSWEAIPDIYKHVILYAQEQDLELYDHAYEEGLNEAVIHDISEYITMITIPCKRKR